jgi:single-strand DNA-binding protein
MQSFIIHLIFFDMQTMKNTVSLTGHLGSDVQLYTLSTGRKVAKVRLATNEFYTDKSGERAKHTEWHNIIGWGTLAEQMEKQLAKGTKVMIEGKLVHRSYQDKNGKTRYLSEIIVGSFVNAKQGGEPVTE